MGPLVPPGPWEGRIVGVFPKAVSVLHPDGALISVVDRESRMEARALAHPEGWARFARAAAAVLDPGGSIPLRWDGSVLSVPGGIADLSLDFSGGRIWNPRLEGAAPSPDSAAEAAAALRALIAKAESVAGLSGGLCDGGVYERAFASLEESDDFPACLVGFGPGTTPGGDDWLVGYLCARDLRASAYGGSEAGLRKEIAARLGRTTSAGRSLLLGAVAGVPPAYLHELALALARGNTARVRKAVRDALGHGASSGRDALEGFLAGLSGGPAERSSQ